MTRAVRHGDGNDRQPEGNGARRNTAHVDVTPSGVGRQVRAVLTTGGEIIRFSGQVLRSLPDLRHHSGEILSQAAILILSSGLIIWMMQFVMGYQCGLEGKYFFDQLGAPLYSGAFSSWCLLREMVPYMFGYIFAAKVGCGFVAEIGSMRIAEEIDAMEVMGVKSRSYLVGTRILAAWIAVPFLFLVGVGVAYAGAYLVNVYMLSGVSEGTYEFVFWLFQNPVDLTFSLVKVMAMATVIIFVSCYYGYTATGGPVGVGKNTAKSMILNLLLIHVVGMLMTQFLWGVDPNAPIAN
ncbi:phospholipid/cholesterol/gamma-HCH transport system permease protein [Haloechinothrix alba]|uniref:Phospholipid/cholesterol/gamma-HCH transport system permease protein n=1 Tax=Haloechinothrix alba TaxID=664784 RepID=A0A238ZFX7_9PSEU|nr:phospholipid/cholesterol/gamma-HCH transport system permease protein [Haloechinothrix alba]